MKNIKLPGFCLVFCFAFWGDVQASTRHSTADTLTMRGLSAPVEIIKDRWGISHIYAQTQPDLFFAQGFNAARDRLFQFEMWATGKYFPVFFSRQKVQSVAASVTVLKPE